MIYSIGYPYKTLISGGYSIECNSETIYSGYAYPFPGQSTASVDISEILRGYVKPFDFSSSLFTLHKSPNSSYTPGDALNYTVNVRKNDSSDVTGIKFVWDYTGKIGSSNNGVNVCNYITPVVYVGQIVPFSLDVTNSSVYNVKYGSAAVKLTQFNSADSTGGRIACLFKLYTTGGSTIHVSRDGTTTKIVELPVEDCVPDNTFTLYYINLSGTVDYVHMTGTNKVETNVNRSQITKTSDYSTPTAFGISNYNIDTYNSYTLNTGVFNDDQSVKFQEVLKSPMCWLQDYKNNTLKSVVITDNKMTVKNRSNDNIYNYTLKLRDSQTYSINA